MGLLSGKKALILGVANKRSIAWGIARAFAREGAELALTYQNERFREKIEPLLADLGAAGEPLLLPCDVAQDEQIAALVEDLAARWRGLDVLVHSIAYAQREDLEGSFASTQRDGFRLALDISAYSLVALAGSARRLMEGRQASILTMTYLGSQRAMPNYNVMGVAKAALEANVRYLAAELGPAGIRVNAISAGPIRTLAASGIRGFTDMLQDFEERVPLRHRTTPEEVGDAAVFLASDLARGVTGDILYVDSGYHVLGV